MNIRTRLFGSCVAASTDPNVVELDLDSFVRRLLLFETYILQSVHLQELPKLNAVFGASGVRTLIEAGALRFQCDALSIGNAGQTDLLANRGDPANRYGPLPLGSFSMVVVRAHDNEQLITKALRNAHENAKLKDAIKLKNAILGALDQPPPGFGTATLRESRANLRNDAFMRAMIVKAASTREAGIVLPSKDLRFEVQPLQGEAFRIESNLGDLLGIDKNAEHRILEQAAFAVYDMNYRIEEMRTYNALSGALGDEVLLFDQKLGFIVKALDPSVQEQQFGRVLEIRGFPSLTTGEIKIDADALLKARATSECVEFRSWLQSLDGASDDEIRERVAGLRARVDTAFQSTTGQTIRFLLTTALGFLSGAAGMAIGLGASVLDQFLLNRLLSASGPTFFINKLYPSIFRHRT